MEVTRALKLSVFAHGVSMIRLHPQLCARLSVGEGERAECTFGRLSAQAPVWADPALPADTVAVSTPLADRLLLRDVAARVRVWPSGRKFHIGPTVGVLSNPRWIEKQKRYAPSPLALALERLADAADRIGALAYVFRMRDVDWEGQRVHAFVHTTRGAWTRMWLPLPDVVYDQVVSRRLEQDANYQRDRARLARLYQDKMFNAGFFDKWQVYEWLAQDVRLRRHIPSTIRYQQADRAARFLAKHSVVFAKPAHGSLGLGIVRFVRQPDGTWICEVKRKQKPPWRVQADHALAAIQQLRPRLEARPYILQQGIDLARTGDRPFDIRIVLQRDGTGAWRRTKMFARIAGPGEFTSNLSSGGQALPVPVLLSTVFPASAVRSRCMRQIRRVARLVAEAMERGAGQTFGELGIDIGIDTTGEAWVIEVNSKPWKSPSTGKGRPELVEMAFRRPMEYAVYLATRQ